MDPLHSGHRPERMTLLRENYCFDKILSSYIRVFPKVLKTFHTIPFLKLEQFKYPIFARTNFRASYFCVKRKFVSAKIGSFDNSIVNKIRNILSRITVFETILKHFAGKSLRELEATRESSFPKIYSRKSLSPSVKIVKWRGSELRGS